MRGLPTPVSVPVMGPVREVPPCRAGSFLSVQKGTKETPGNAPGGTTAPRAFRLGPAVRFPRPPMRETRALDMAPASGAGGDDTQFPVCAAAAGVSNGHAHPAVVSRLDWQNRAAGAKSAGAQKLKISPRRGGFQPPEKPSPQGEGVTADAVTDEVFLSASQSQDEGKGVRPGRAPFPCISHCPRGENHGIMKDKRPLKLKTEQEGLL